jgi:uracil-DNA glycosylase
LSSKLERFVEKLAQTPATINAYNQYAPNNPYNDIRRANLLQYLRHMTDRKPSLMFVMEAPGYRGCRLTGIPVMSRKFLLEGVPDLEMFGKEHGYQDIPEPEFAHIQSEQTATIMWQTLSEIRHVPMIWSSFPFHPHLPNQSLTNRKPLKNEVELGRIFLRELLEIFTPQHIVAVGNVGDETLTYLRIPHAKVRHPAQGGKNDFVAGIKALATSLNLSSQS